MILVYPYGVTIWSKVGNFSETKSNTSWTIIIIISPTKINTCPTNNEISGTKKNLMVLKVILTPLI